MAYCVTGIVLMIGICIVILLSVARFIKADNLVQAAEAGDIGEVKRLLLAGAAINASGMHGMTPLMAACKGGDLSTVQYLISEGADVNGHNDSGSVLMWAIDSGNAKIVLLLLENKVDISWKNTLSENALEFARKGGNNTIIALFESRN